MLKNIVVDEVRIYENTYLTMSKGICFYVKDGCDYFIRVTINRLILYRIFELHFLTATFRVYRYSSSSIVWIA